jgi:hypothetical protein
VRYCRRISLITWLRLPLRYYYIFVHILFSRKLIPLGVASDLAMLALPSRYGRAGGWSGAVRGYHRLRHDM